jgi:hypothetical protein
MSAHGLEYTVRYSSRVLLFAKGSPCAHRLDSKMAATAMAKVNNAITLKHSRCP